MPIVAQTPPATTPALERITQHIVDSLATITVANGYSVDAEVKRPNPGVGDGAKDGTLVVIVGGATIQDPPQMLLQWEQSFSIHGQVEVSENAADPTIDTLLIKRVSEVIWCLTHDSDGTREQTTRGGLAQDTKFVGLEVYADPNAHDAEFVVEITVQYRTALNNPFASSTD
jgi:hypothetical protein